MPSASAAKMMVSAAQSASSSVSVVTLVISDSSRSASAAVTVSVVLPEAPLAGITSMIVSKVNPGERLVLTGWAQLRVQAAFASNSASPSPSVMVM